MRGAGPFRLPWQTKYKGAKQRSRIQLLVDNLLPAIDNLDPDLESGELYTQAIEMNVRWTVKTIMESPEGKARQAEGVMKCIGAIYEIETGRVRFLE